MNRSRQIAVLSILTIILVFTFSNCDDFEFYDLADKTVMQSSEDINNSTGTTTGTAVDSDPEPLAINPSRITLVINNSYTILPTGGITPYSFVLNAGSAGTLSIINDTTAEYTAPSDKDNATSVSITDTGGTTVTLTIMTKKK